MGRSPARTKLSFVCAMLVPASLFGQTPDEAAARAALDRDPPAQDLVIRAKALSFPDPSHPGIVALVAEVPGGELRYEIDRAKTSYKADAIVLFRIRDGAGRTVRTVSAHEARTGPFADLDGARAQPVTFYRQMELLPGTYTIDAAVYDTLSGLAGVQRSRLEAPETSDAGKLRLSTLTLVKALERVPESARSTDHPLSCDDLLVHPNLDEPVSKSAQGQLVFFLTAYQRKDAPRPKATVEILHEGHRLTQLAITLSPPDSRGRIQHLGGLNLAALEAGTYDLRVVVSDSQSLQTRSVSFTVVD